MRQGATVGAVIEAAPAAPAEPDQLDLLPPTRFPEGSSAHAEFAARIEGARRGRPPGARNLATRQVVEFVRKVFGDPFVESARYLAHTPETLAAELECSKLEAFQALERIRADLRGFMYPRLAPVGADGAAVPPTFVMAFADRGAPGAAPGVPPWELRRPRLVEAQNQPDASNPASKSHEGKSHEPTK